ncbi:DUF2062 domain-containing protein [Candidatus Woesearchaeota archaeon]|nr:DUF2062 domain-containing protein [Candidatus Woesearchaeota archaeon]
MQTLIKIYQRLKETFKKDKLKKIFLTIVKSHTSPHQIALGAAIGVFLSILPTFSIGMFLALFIAWKKKLNLLATYLGTLVVNPIYGSFVYFLNYKFGNFILGNNQSIIMPITLDNIKFVAKQVYLGGIIISTITSILVYFLLYSIVVKYRERRERKKK